MPFLKNTFLYFFVISVYLMSNAFAVCDLEENAQEFFIDIKQVIIPECPDAFNPSLIKWKGRWLLSFRWISEESEVSSLCSATHSKVGLIYLDEQLNPIGSPYFISLSHPEQKRTLFLAEDARLIICDGRLLMIYSGNKEEKIEDGGFRMYVAELKEEINGFRVVSNECLSVFANENPKRREKNWVPFVFNNTLLLGYQLDPHTIFRPLLDSSECCETVAISFPSVIWEWGQLRGGAPAVKIDEDHYLSIFHSSTHMKTIHSNDQEIPHYFIGAYVFSAHPPFEIKYISPEPIIGPNFYHGACYEPYWHPVCVVFPCGLAINGDDVLISYGRQDHELWIATVDKEKLLENFIHVSNLK